MCFDVTMKCRLMALVTHKGKLMLKLERASEWGTHVFKRGWANEALQAGGAVEFFSFVRWGYALSRNPPASIGYGGFPR